MIGEERFLMDKFEPPIPKDVVMSVGMWTVTAIPGQLVRTLHWNGDMVVAMNSPWYDVTKFAAAMILHAQISLIKDGTDPVVAKDMVWDKLQDELNVTFNKIWEDFMRQQRASA